MAHNESREKMDLLNNAPVSRKAREILEKSGEAVPRDAFPCSLLAVWGVEKGGVDVEASVYETACAMLTWRPERLMNFLMIPRDGIYEPEGWLEAGDGYELAIVILDDIERNLLKHFPFCGTAE
jgi:hypothetical protein